MDLERAFDDDSAGPAFDCARWFRAALTGETRKWLQRLDVGVFDAPLRDDDTMVSYCPRCHAQFGTRSDDVCVSCPSTKLVAFPSSELTVHG
jgi:hypothetical protein